MGKIRLKCAACGAEFAATDEGADTPLKCPSCGATLRKPKRRPAPAPDARPDAEAEAAADAAGPASAANLRLRLALNLARRCPLAVYRAARSWGERYETWMRVLLCLLPFGVGGLASWCLWLFLPSENAFGVAGAVLLATVALGLPVLVVFFPGYRAARARESLERLRAKARDLRAELSNASAVRGKARAERSAARAEIRREHREAGAAGPAAERRPYPVIRAFSHIAYWLGLIHMGIAALVLGATFVLLLVRIRQLATGEGWITWFALMGTGAASAAAGALAGVLMLFVRELLAWLADTAYNLRKVADALAGAPEAPTSPSAPAPARQDAPRGGPSPGETPASSARQQVASLLQAFVGGTIGGGELIKRYPEGYGKDELLDAIINVFCSAPESGRADPDEHFRLVARAGLQAVNEDWDAQQFRKAADG